MIWILKIIWIYLMDQIQHIILFMILVLLHCINSMIIYTINIIIQILIFDSQFDSYNDY